MFRIVETTQGIGLALLIGLVALLGLSVQQQAVAAEAEGAAIPMAAYVEGTHYQKIPIPVQTQLSDDAADKVEVVEVFSYGCIHCFNFDPVVDAWAKRQADRVEFRRTPAIFNASWALLARAFYTAEVLGVSERMHVPLFHAIHKEPINLGDPELMARLFRTEAGVSPDAFSQAFDSFTVRSRVQQADGHGRAYRLRAVPSMVVDGKYLVDSSMVGNRNDEMLKVVEYLIDMSKAEAATAAR